MSEANKRQVAGNHYQKSGVQHWDWAAAKGLSYFTGCATKYVERWKEKGGLDDLKKAEHYLQKALEPVPNVNSEDYIDSTRFDRFQREILTLCEQGKIEEAREMLNAYIKVHSPRIDPLRKSQVEHQSTHQFVFIGAQGNLALYDCRRCKTNFSCDLYEELPWQVHDCAGRNYVDQGRDEK